MVYGWFRQDGKQVWGFVLAHIANTLLIEDAQDFTKRHTVHVREFHGTQFRA